jgi:hypothetical protein
MAWFSVSQQTGIAEGICRINMPTATSMVNLW